MRRLRKTLLIHALLFASPVVSINMAFADDSFLKNWGGSLGGSYEAGQLQNSGMSLPSRFLTAESLEGFVGYYVVGTRLLLGIDFDYRFQQQQTNIANSGGTNLAGHGYLFGVSANYQLNDQWSLHGALDPFGRYSFSKQTSLSQDDHLAGPLSLRLKAQYFF